MEFCWHGSGGFSLRQGGFEFLVDPFFSPPGTYGEWYTPNSHAPRWEDFEACHHPAAVFITHGHFDHFDPEALKRLERRFAPLFLGSRQAMAAVRALVGVDEARTLALEPGGAVEQGEKSGVAEAAQPSAAPAQADAPEPGAPVRVGPFELRAVSGVHWLTGEEGDRAAAKLAGRPERYGVMPCGGPMLSLLVEVGAGGDGGAAVERRLRVYISGDTEVAGVPQTGVDVAILNVAGSMLHPSTREECYPAFTVADLPAVVERLTPRLIIPIHYDFEGFHRPVDVKALKEQAKGQGKVRVRLVEHHTWVGVDDTG